MLKHYFACHRDLKREEIRFGVRVRNKYVKSFERQVGEAIAIEQEQLKGTILLNSKSEFDRCSVPRLTIGNYKDNVEEMKEEEKMKRQLRGEIRQLKKRKTETEGNLLEVCNEIMVENYIPWKRRRIQEEIRKKEKDERESEEWERTKRLNKAKWKKIDLIRQLEKKRKKGNLLNGYRINRYRERVEVEDREREEKLNRIISIIPKKERKERREEESETEKKQIRRKRKIKRRNIDRETDEEEHLSREKDVIEINVTERERKIERDTEEGEVKNDNVSERCSERKREEEGREVGISMIKSNREAKAELDGESKKEIILYLIQKLILFSILILTVLLLLL